MSHYPKVINGTWHIYNAESESWVDTEDAAQGPKGDTGETGATGPKGDKGDKGEQGIQGIQGIQGEKGDKGDKGDTGEKGDKGDPGEVTLADFYKAFATDTATGAIAHFTDGADSIPMKDVLVHIEPVQAGSGDPSPDNVRPITGWTGAKVTRTGKNLFPRKTISLGKPRDRTATVIFDQPIKPGTYIVSYKKSGTYTDMGFGIDCFNGNKNIGYININTGVLTISEEGTRLYFYYPRSNYDNNETLIFDEIQLELDSTATAYEPYQGETLDITFPSEAGTVYGGTLDVTKGELVVDRAIVDLGTLNWSVECSAGHERAYSGVIDGIKPYASTKVANAICSQYAVTSNNSVYTHTHAGIFAVDDNRRIQLYDSRYISASSDEFKTAMSGVQLVCELASPITYQLTPQEITSLLGQNNVWADTGDTEVEYRASTKMYIDNLTRSTEDDMTANTNISKDAYFTIGNTLYKASTAISKGETIVPNTNCTIVSLADALNTLAASTGGN